MFISDISIMTLQVCAKSRQPSLIMSSIQITSIRYVIGTEKYKSMAAKFAVSTDSAACLASSGHLQAQLWQNLNLVYQHMRGSFTGQGLYSLRRRRLISIGIPIINMRRSSDRLRFIMGIPIPVRRRRLSEWRPWYFWSQSWDWEPNALHVYVTFVVFFRQWCTCHEHTCTSSDFGFLPVCRVASSIHSQLMADTPYGQPR